MVHPVSLYSEFSGPAALPLCHVQLGSRVGVWLCVCLQGEINQTAGGNGSPDAGGLRAQGYQKAVSGP